jgi:DNA replication initiation complex subunit (GINS family)
MADKEIVITYDTLYDLLRREKNSGEIQKLDDDFFEQVLSYLSEKQALLNSNPSDQGLFGFEEKRKLIQQLENAHKILTDLYEWREKKIIGMARDVSHTNSSIANTSFLLPPEKELYEETLCLLNKFRKNLLINILSGNDIPLGLAPCSQSLAEGPKGIGEPKALNTNVKLSDAEEGEGVKIRFVESVPPFMGPDMKEYGPFDSEEIQELPEDIADLMIRKGCAEKIEG